MVLLLMAFVGPFTAMRLGGYTQSKECPYFTEIDGMGILIFFPI